MPMENAAGPLFVVNNLQVLTQAETVTSNAFVGAAVDLVVAVGLVAVAVGADEPAGPPFN